MAQLVVAVLPSETFFLVKFRLSRKPIKLARLCGVQKLMLLEMSLYQLFGESKFSGNLRPRTYQSWNVGHVLPGQKGFVKVVVDGLLWLRFETCVEL